MTRVLNEKDVKAVREVILTEITTERQDLPGDRAQALEGVLEIVLSQALIPVLVSLTSSLLTEVIKGKVLSSIRRREAEQKIKELLQRPLQPTAELENECMLEMRRLLGPLGVTESDIKRMYKTVKQRMEIENGQVKFSKPGEEKARAEQGVQANTGKQTLEQSHQFTESPKSNAKTPEATVIKILFLAANPYDTSPLGLGEEVRTIDERLRLAQFRERFELVQHHAVRIADLSEALLRHQPHVVHFSGHGSSSGQIILEDVTGKGEYITAGAIAK